MMKNELQKYNNVINNNTFYYYNPSFEQRYENELNAIIQVLLLLKNQIDNCCLSKELIESFLINQEYGLDAILALTGISGEDLKRLVTLIRATNDSNLSRISNKSAWPSSNHENDISEWGMPTIKKMIKENKSFRMGIINLFFEGGTDPFLIKTVAPFTLKKLSLSKLTFSLESLLDTITRYKSKGAYSAKSDNNAETMIKEAIEDVGLEHQNGKLEELIPKNVGSKNRKMDFIIPSKRNPKIIIESSYLITTSSGQGDKAKTEIGVSNLIKKHYPESKFIGFVDGIGWYVRKKDLERMVEAYEDVFTLHPKELERFKAFLVDSLLGK